MACRLAEDNMQKFTENIAVEKLLSRQIGRWEHSADRHRRTFQEKAMPCITISREIGSHGTELGKKICSTMNWELYDRDLVEMIANNAKVRTRMVESFDERTQGEIDTWVLTLLDKHTLASDKYFKYLIQTIVSIEKAGGAVIIGRGANYILSPERALRLKIVAPKETRVQNIVAKKNVSAQEAERIIEVVDRDRLQFNRRFFHRDGDDPLSYDLVINTGNLNLETAEAIVLEALRKKTV
jgi:cytidylate kinase